MGEHVTNTNDNSTEWRQYTYDGNALVRQTTDSSEAVTFAWTFSPEGAVVLGEEGPVSHLACSGDAVYDFSTGLIFKNGRYYDPGNGIWLTGSGVVAFFGVTRRKKNRHQRRREKKLAGIDRVTWLWILILLVVLLAGCGSDPTPTPIPNSVNPTETCTPTPLAVPLHRHLGPTPQVPNPTANSATGTSTPYAQLLQLAIPVHQPIHKPLSYSEQFTDIGYSNLNDHHWIRCGIR